MHYIYLKNNQKIKYSLIVLDFKKIKVNKLREIIWNVPASSSTTKKTSEMGYSVDENSN